MKILKANAVNFGSYREIEFSYDGQGLVLLYGPTGAGKSTLQDLVLWCLYGTTAKGGKVDDVVNWEDREGGHTQVSCGVLLPSGRVLHVVRTRGTGGRNDLHWGEYRDEDHYNESYSEDGVREMRGKDLLDTQCLLVGALGVSEDAYLLCSYFNEWSGTNSFFSGTAKQRREMFENIADTSLADRVQGSSAVALARAKDRHDAATRAHENISCRLDTLGRSKAQEQAAASSWEQNQTDLIDSFEEKALTFEAEKRASIAEAERTWQAWEEDRQKQTQELVDRIKYAEGAVSRLGPVEDAIAFVQEGIVRSTASRCTVCGGPDPKLEEQCNELVNLNKQLSDKDRHLKQISIDKDKILRLNKAQNPYGVLLQKARTAENPHFDRVRTEKSRVNPHKAKLTWYDQEVGRWYPESDRLLADIAESGHDTSVYTQLKNLSQELRGELIKQTIGLIERTTNAYLDRYFDAEFRVTFSAGGADKLDVELFKDGNACGYRQLSKGQRQLLKLTFAVSVMKACQYKVGMHFGTLFFDESLDGLDADLKLKAYGLFQELAATHDSVFVIDHSPELQQLFGKHYRVELTVEGSKLYAES